MGGVGEEREGRRSVFDESEGEAVADGFVGVVHVEFFQDVLAAHFCTVFPDVNCPQKFCV